MRIFLIPFVVPFAGAIAMAADLPKYNLPVGRHLVYSSQATATEEGQAKSETYRNDFSVTVVAQNPDGSAHVILESSTHLDDGSTDRASFGYADLFPDGHYKPNPTLKAGMSTKPIFPLLPASDAQLKSQWQAEEPNVLKTDIYHLISDSGGEFVLGSVQDGPINRIYITTRKETLHFDLAKGMLSSAETETSQDFGFHSKSTGSLTLISDEMIDATKTAQMAKDFDVYFDADAQYMNLLHEIGDDPASAQKLLDQAKKIVQQAAAQVTSDPAHAELARMLKNHDAYAKNELESAEHDLKFLNKPSPSWSATDLDGKEWKLDDLRGKVVVMDFWYRGCGWCMYAMPQVKQVAGDFKDKNVVVLGMNTDHNEDDAKFVIKEFGLPYPQLKAADIPKLYGINGFPTLLVIDQQGVIRVMETGYSPTLHDTVAKKIDELLKTTG